MSNRTQNRGVVRRCEAIIGVGEHQGQRCGVPFQLRSMVGVSGKERFCEEHRGVVNNPRGRAGLHTGTNKHYQTKNAETMQKYLIGIMDRTFGDPDKLVDIDELAELITPIIKQEIVLHMDQNEDAIKELHEEIAKLQRQLITLNNRLK